MDDKSTIAPSSAPTEAAKHEKELAAIERDYGYLKKVYAEAFGG